MTRSPLRHSSRGVSVHAAIVAVLVWGLFIFVLWFQARALSSDSLIAPLTRPVEGVFDLAVFVIATAYTLIAITSGLGRRGPRSRELVRRS